MDTQLTLSVLMEPVDKYDHFLLEDILLLVQDHDTMEIIKYWGHTQFNKDKCDEVYFLAIQRSINALMKANALRRNYEILKDKLKLELETSSDIKGTNIDMLFYKIDALVLLDSFLTNIKTSLDLLAQSLTPLFNINCDNWGKKLDSVTGKELSGLKLVGTLRNNVKISLNHNIQPVIKMITEHAEKITSIVNYRDSSVHSGYLKNVQGFRYSVKDKKVYYPLISLGDNEAMFVHDYMEEKLGYMIEFTQDFIITCLSNLLPDTFLTQDAIGKWHWSMNIKQ